MRLLTFRSVARIAAATLIAGFTVGGSFAQDNSSNAPPPPKSVQTLDVGSGQSDQQPAAPVPPPVNPKELADYKALYDTPESDTGTKIQLGNAFLANYPASTHQEAVFTQLLHAYFTKQDWDKFYSTGDNVLDLDPDDVDALTLIGWVIPRAFQAADPDSPFKLAKAETYEKHAIEVLATIQKPATLTDTQFAETKETALEQAHSGLGLVYFREQKASDSVAELQQATANSNMPDSTDLFILGVELAQLGRTADAVDAFAKCSAIPGALQDQCKQRGDAAKKQPATVPH